jgi:glycosyltransferase involved in cell wall biosynthesis
MTEAPFSRTPPRLLSVVIPARNAAGLLARQLRALAGQTYVGPWEVVIADNGSTDGTGEVVRTSAGGVPAVRLVDASRRRGINCARNEGARAARGDFLLFCDADDEVSPVWLGEMVKAASTADLVGGPLDRRTLNDPLTVAWRWPSPEAALPVAHEFLPYAEGSNFGIWADVLQALGGWNEDYAGGGDDVELCWRAQLAGYRIGFATKAVIRYRHRPELRAMARQVFGYGFGDTKLYRDFRGRGLRRPNVRLRLREWGRLVGRAADLFHSRESRGAWVRDAAYWAGRVRGSLHHRVPFV